MTTSTITLSTRYPSNEGHDTVINAENFETLEKLEAYVLNFLDRQHSLSIDGRTVLKECLSIRCHRIAYTLSQAPELSHDITISSNIEFLSPHQNIDTFGRQPSIILIVGPR